MGPPAESEYAVEPVGVADDQPVGFEGADILLVHISLEIDHARDLGFVDDDVVQSFVRAYGLAGAHQVAMQHAARDHALLAVQRALQFRIKLIERDGGQKA